jgi:broad specificity phosphatase PhoE
MHELWLIRHGETEWSRSGAHTSHTDIPLTETGRARADAIGNYLSGPPFALVLVSPLLRARQTCTLAGYMPGASLDSDLREWDYGDYEGLTTPQILTQDPQWSLWTDGAPNGESPDQVAARADAVIARTERADADVLLFSHGHFLRVLAARWLEMPPAEGRRFALGTGTVSSLGYERRTRVITRWNLSPSA